jgi:hypothetical protein
MLLADLMSGVRAKLGGRADVDARSPIWIKDAILELTESYPFDQLQVTGPIVQFVIGISEYPITKFTNNNELPTIIDDWWCSSTTTIGATPDNLGQSGRYLKFRTKPIVDIMSKVRGQVSKWTKNGSNFIVGNQPQQAFATYMRYQRQHPFNCSLFDTASLQQQTVLMPDSWSIIVEMTAAIIGAYELRMLDYATIYHQALYGDPDFQKTGRGNPGLIFARTSNYNRDSGNNERQLQMVTLRTCSS